MIKVSGILLLNIIIFLPLNLHSQNFDINHITYANGFSNSQISTLNEDQYGFIWVGTNGGGLYRWDGTVLKPIYEGLKYETILTVLIDSTDNKYVSTYTKIIKLDYKNNCSAKLNLKSELLYPNDIITNLFRFQDKIVAFSNFGLALVISSDSLKILQKLSVAKEFYNYSVIQSDSSFTLVNKFSYLKLSLNADTLVINKDKTKITLLDDSATIDKTINVALVSDGHIFLHHAHSLYKLNNEFEIENKYSLALKETIFCIIEAADAWWIGTSSGLYQYKEEDGSLVQIDQAIDKSIWSMLKTKQNLWVGSTVGLFNLFNHPIKLLASEQFKGIAYVDFEKVGNTIWALSATSGIHIYKNNVVVDTIKLGQNPPTLYRSLKLFDRDSVYVGSSRGLFKININRKEPILTEGFNYPLFSIDNSNETTVLSSLGYGIFKKVGNTFQNFSRYNDSLRVRFVTQTATSGSKIFIGAENGLFYLKDTIINKIDLSDKFAVDLPVTSLLVLNKELLLIGTRGYGIVVYHTEQNKIVYQWKEPFLSSNAINSLTEIDGCIWVGTALGIDVAEFKPDSVVFSKLSTLATIAGAETLLWGVQEVGKEVWVSTIAGLISIPKTILSDEKQRSASKVIIESAMYDKEKTVVVFQNNTQTVPVLEIPFNQEELVISFNSLNFDGVRFDYAYQLINYDKEVTKQTNVKQATYKKLPPGEYEFQVWQENPFDNISEKAILFIRIVPPFYMTMAFKIGMVVLMLLTLVYFISAYSKMKNKRILAREKHKEEARGALRKEMAIDFHDEMGNHLATIINLSGVLKLQRVPKKFFPVIDKIETNAKKLFASTSDLIWSLKSESCTIEELFLLIKDFTENLFEHSKTSIRFYNMLNGHLQMLDAQRSRDITLIMKEIITNIYKHAFAENVSVTFAMTEEIIIVIADDGIGFNGNAIKSNGGVSNMHQRATRSAVTIEFATDHERISGTKVELKLK